MSEKALLAVCRSKRSNRAGFTCFFPDRQGDFNLFDFDGFLPVSLFGRIDKRGNSDIRVLTAQTLNRV